MSHSWLDPKVLARLQTLQLRAQHIVEGYVAGAHRSPYKGFSIEFAEHREYAPGDDLRYVDWKVFGRTDKFYLKQYEDETNLVAYVVLDASESMSYQGPDASLTKYEYAQCLSAALSWLVLHQQDAVGMTVFDEQIRHSVRPSSNASHLHQLLQVMESTTPVAKTATGPIFHELAERFRKRGVVIIISDFFDDVDTMMAGLKHFRHRRHDVVLMHVLDPAELDFPFSRPTMFQGLEAFPEILADPKSLRRAYLEEFQRFCKKLSTACRTHGIDYQQMRTDQPLDRVLANYLSQRMARMD